MTLNDESVVSETLLDLESLVTAGGLRITVGGGPPAMLALSGELDLASVERLREAVSDIDAPSGHVTIDMSGVVFIDLAGLQAIAEAVARLRSTGGVVELILSDSVAWLLSRLDAAGCPISLAGNGNQPTTSPQ